MHCQRFTSLTLFPDREEATREDDLGLGGDYEDDDEEEWEAEVDWGTEENDETEDIKDESATYLEFLSQQVRYMLPSTIEASY